MDDATIQRLRPRDNTVTAIREAIAAVRAERDAVQQRIALLAADRPRLMLDGTTAELRAAEEATRDAERDLMQLDAIATALQQRLTDAAAAEAAEEYRRRFDAAAAAVGRYNAWFSKSYAKHARAIAEGAALEREAIQLTDGLRQGGAFPDGMPRPTPVFVGREARALSFLLRLPATEPGNAIWWG